MYSHWGFLASQAAKPSVPQTPVTVLPPKSLFFLNRRFTLRSNCLDTKKSPKKVKRPHPSFGHPLQRRGLSGKAFFPLHSKNLRWTAEILQTPPYGRQTRSISTPSALVFWLTGQGHARANCRKVLKVLKTPILSKIITLFP